MKKLFFLLTSLSILVACSDDEKTSPDATPSLIIGEWVYDDPENGIWEKQKFLSNMKFYVSYMNMRPYSTQDNAEGSYYYTEQGKKFTFTYQNIIGGITYQDAVVEEINGYSYTASYYNDDNTFSGRYAYHKLVGSIEMFFDETNTPQYEKMIPNGSIKGYKSNNEKIIKVNHTTGEITANHVSGRTYVNIITEEGVGYVEVIVKDPVNLFPDYSSALNLNEEEAKKQWTEYCVYATPVENCIHYPIIANDYAEMAMLWLDDNKNVECVQLSVKTSVIDDAEREADIHQYLSEKYEYQLKDDGIYMYFDLSNPQLLPMAIYYSPKLNLIEYQKIMFDDLWDDYTQYLGKSSNDVKQKYGEPFYEEATALYYLQDNTYIELVVFSLKENKVYAASAFLKTDCDWQEALNYINRKYYYYEKGSEPSDNYFAFTNKSSLAESNIGITFDGKNGLITYLDLTATKTKSITRKMSVVDFSHIRSGVNNTKTLVLTPLYRR